MHKVVQRQSPGRSFPPRPPRSRAAVGIWVIAAIFAGIAAFGVPSVAGGWFRHALWISTETSPTNSWPTFTDSNEESALFFAERDSVVIRITSPITVRELLRMYHLETNTAARRAIERQTGATQDDAQLRAGLVLHVPLTIARDSL